MSTAIYDLTAESRSEFGKGYSRRLRRLEDKVPAIIYGAHKDTAHVMLPGNIIKRALENEAFYSHILTISLDGKKEKVILKAIQRHPASANVLHMDFQRISAKEKLTMTVPLHFLNEEEAPGVREGGVVTHHMSDIEIRCLPAALPEYIEVDLADLAMNGIIHMSQVSLPKGVELVAAALIEEDHSHDHAVASIHKPAAEIEPEEAEAAEEAEAGEEAPEEGGESEESTEE